MGTASPYTILGLKPGASRRDVRNAYRKLVKKYHPDVNQSPGAAEKFIEITQAYNTLLEPEPKVYKRDSDYERAKDILRKDREKVKSRERARIRKEQEARERYRKSGWYDLVLLGRYLLHAILPLLAIVATILPVILGILVEPVVFLATIFLSIMGIFGAWHIYKGRKTWFALGSFNTTRSDLLNFIRKPPVHATKDYCCYVKGRKADGKSFRIRMVRVMNIKTISYGAMNHSARYTNKTSEVVIPRSARAEFVHRICSMVKVAVILSFLVFFPLTGWLWRLVFGIAAASIASFFILKITRVHSKTSYLVTPALIIKLTVWIAVLFSISQRGPGFDISLGEYSYIAIAGLLFLLDMVFDLVFGLFPFYRRLFVPVIPQGKTMNSLYSEGYQNYIEFPFYSVLQPFYAWIS